MSTDIKMFLRLGAEVCKGIPMTMFGTAPASLMFWLFAALVVTQYRRIENTEIGIYGAKKNRAIVQAGTSLLWGALGGIVASILLVCLGVPLSDSGLAYLFPVALVLMALSPRLMCFAYSGGIISLSYLVFGVPRVNVQTIMALVAILHLTESVLIFLSGAGCATPVFLRNKRNEIVGGFGVQRFWPMPLIAVFLISGARLPEAGGWIATPDWWPLLGLKEAALVNTNLFYVMLPVAAGLGYADIAITCKPAERARKTSALLAVYSLVLLALALGAIHSRMLLWAAALFAPLGHEFVARVGSNSEMRGKPRFVRQAEGVMVLDVLPSTPAMGAGIRSGDVILEVNGRPVNDRDGLRAALEEIPGPIEMVVREDAKPGHERVVRLNGAVDSLGVITVPEPGDDVHMETRDRGVLAVITRTVQTRIRRFLRRRKQ